MDITTLAAWGEFLGGIAVVVSLVYLASQIRQNSNLLRVSATATTAQLHMGQMVLVVTDPEIAEFFYRGSSDPDSLSEAERDRFENFLGIQVQGMHQSFEFQEKGIGSEASWCFTLGGMRWFASQPGFTAWWPKYQMNFLPAFRDYVDALIREGEAAG